LSGTSTLTRRIRWSRRNLQITHSIRQNPGHKSLKRYVLQSSLDPELPVYFTGEINMNLAPGGSVHLFIHQ
jgi:hypothetical protein